MMRLYFGGPALTKLTDPGCPTEGRSPGVFKTLSPQTPGIALRATTGVCIRNIIINFFSAKLRVLRFSL